MPNTEEEVLTTAPKKGKAAPATEDGETPVAEEGMSVDSAYEAYKAAVARSEHSFKGHILADLERHARFLSL